MANFSGYFQKIEHINLNRFLRKSFVERVVPVLKMAFSFLTVVLLIVSARSIIDNSLARETEILQNRNQIRSTVDGIRSETSMPLADRDFKTLSKRELFGELGSQAAPAATPVEKPKSSLSLALIGTFIFANESPFAIIEDGKDKSQRAFGINDTVFGVAQLKAVYPDRVEISREGKSEILSLKDTSPDSSTGPSDGGAGGASGTEFIVDNDELDKALENMPLLLTQARAVPYFQEGKAVGFRLFAIKSGSLYEKIGLKNGDIIKSVNGNSMGDPSQALELFKKLKEERNLNVRLERQKEEVEFRYSIR